MERKGMKMEVMEKEGAEKNGKEERGMEKKVRAKMIGHERMEGASRQGKEGEEQGVDRVFVYGTLMEGFWNHMRVLEGKADFLGNGEIQGRLYHLREGYPALLEGGDRVVGEVYGPVDRKLLRQLDELEGYAEGNEGCLYKRRPVAVDMSDGSTMTCWTYVYGDISHVLRTGRYLPHGDWRRHMRGEEA